MENKIIDFAQNFNILGSPLGSLAAAKDFTKYISSYPDPVARGSGSRAAANFFSISESNLMLAHGATEVFFKAHEFLEYSRALIPVPAFWEYKEFNIRFSVPVETLQLREEDGFVLNTQMIEDALISGDAVFLCNINNPTSVLMPGQDILKIALAYPENNFVVDETYLLFHPDFEKHTLSQQATKISNVHVVVSFSKLFSLPGIRIGAVISDEKTVRRYQERSFVPYSISGLTQHVLACALADTNFVSNTRKYYSIQKQEFFDQLKNRFGNRVKVLKPEGNFVLMKMLSGVSSKQTVSLLIDQGIIVRGGHELEGLGDSWLRVAIKDRESHEKLLDALDLIL
ncbi:MAG: aminotransferase class I/II-fold pyridoxal phosphate-dependent enzyme [Candidatus Paceibacterota bacterium]